MVVAGQYGVIMRVMIPGRILFPLTSGSTSGFVRPMVDIIYNDIMSFFLFSNFES